MTYQPVIVPEMKPLIPQRWLLNPHSVTIFCLLQDNQEVFTSLYTMKWFFQCFLDRVSAVTSKI